MSTRLEYGVRIKDQSIWDFLQDLGVAMREVWDEEARSLAARQISRAWVETEPGELVFLAADELWRDVDQQTKDDFLKFEFAFSQSPRGYLLGYPFGARTLIDAFFALPQVESWGYQNSTDPEEGVAPAEWEERRVEWDALLDLDAQESLASLPVWKLPRYEDIFLPVLLRSSTGESIAASVDPPIELARSRIIFEVGHHLRKKKDYKAWLGLHRYVNALPVEELGPLPRPFTDGDLGSTDRCEYETPEALKADLQRRFGE